MTSDDFRALAAALPGVEEGPCYGTPGWRVRGRILARLWPDGETLVMARVGFDEREMLIEVEPETFFITDHYRNYPSILVRLATVEPATLNRLLLQAWRQAAPKKMITAYDEAARSAG